MSLAEEVDVLRQIALFERMEPPKLKLLAMTSDRVTFRPGQSMMRQGDDGDAAYVVITGTADVLVNTPNGPLKVAELGAGQIIGEIAILVDIPRTATVEAQGELVALKVSKDNFLRLLNNSPQVGIEIIRVLAGRLENTTQQLREAIANQSK
jgi:CRP-like cAMP-binding protein